MVVVVIATDSVILTPYNIVILSYPVQRYCRWNDFLNCTMHGQGHVAAFEFP